MAKEIRSVNAKCTACVHCEIWGFEASVRALVRAGKFRRGSSPDPEVVFELLFAFVGQLICSECRAVGLQLTWREDSDDTASDWQDAVLCEACRKPIPEERLAVVHDATLCVRCQDQQDRGVLRPMAVESDLCPRCGSPPKMEHREVGGVTRYAMVCTNSPRCRG